MMRDRFFILTGAFGSGKSTLLEHLHLRGIRGIVEPTRPILAEPAKHPGRSSRALPNWLLTKANEITDLILLDQTFLGGRPTASGKHIKWDVLFIRVKPAGMSGRS